MKYLAISKEIPPIDWDILSETLKEEASVLHQLYITDQIREFYFTDRGDAVLMLECSSIYAAQEVVQQLPLVKQGMIVFGVMELRPYTGFERLFKE